MQYSHDEIKDFPKSFGDIIALICVIILFFAGYALIGRLLTSGHWIMFSVILISLGFLIVRWYLKSERIRKEYQASIWDEGHKRAKDLREKA